MFNDINFLDSSARRSIIAIDIQIPFCCLRLLLETKIYNRNIGMRKKHSRFSFFIQLQ